MRIIFDRKVMALMDAFNKATGAVLKDCIDDPSGPLIFIVAEGEMGKAIGKGGKNVRILEKRLNRKIKIVEFNPDRLKFILNLVFPVKIKEIAEAGGEVRMEALDLKGRGLLIGRAAQNLRMTESIAKRYFDIKEIRVI